MAETVEPNARMFRNALDSFSARKTPLQRVVLAGGAKSYGFHLGSFNAPAKESQPRLIAPIHYHQQEDILKAWSEKTGTSWTVFRPHVVLGPSLNSPMNLVTGVAVYAVMSRELGLPLRFPGLQEGWNSLQQACDAELFSGVGKVASNAITPAPPALNRFTSNAYEVRGKGKAPTFWRVFSSIPTITIRSSCGRCKAP